MKALVYAQHLLGTGHVVRAAALARTLAARGVKTTLVSGNRIPRTLDTGGLEVALLPPARAADAEFSGVVDDSGAPISDAWKAARRDRLLSLYDALDPDILVTETWPFGRNAFAFELEPLLDRAHMAARRPLIASSIRDILVRKQSERKERRMADRARARFDLVLVHGDPSLITLEASFPFAGEIADLIRYTGYIDTGADAPVPPAGDGTDEVIVSCGGGAVGQALLETALAARGHSTRAGDRLWRCLVGTDLSDAVLTDLAANAGQGLIVEPARRDFPALLDRARLSISQCGYNTAVDVLTAGCAAVFVPFARGGETEQSQRADLLAERGLAVTVPEAGLTPPKLAKAVDDALAKPRQTLPIAANGARTAADIILEHAATGSRG